MVGISTPNLATDVAAYLQVVVNVRIRPGSGFAVVPAVSAKCAYVLGNLLLQIDAKPPFVVSG